MCLIAFAYDTHPKYKLVVLANRDEFYQRSTQEMHYWVKEGIYAGKDNVAGGTWMGLSKTGKFAALTNYRDLKSEVKGRRSRGEIVLDILNEDLDVESYFNNFNDTDYNGFNVISLDDQFRHYSNITGKTTRIDSGIYGVSNALFDTDWPKVTQLKSDLKMMLEDPNLDFEKGMMALKGDEIYPDDKLPDTGVGLDLERKLSAAFIKMERYGTRSSTVLTLTFDGQFEILERTYANGITDQHFMGKIAH